MKMKAFPRGGFADVEEQLVCRSIAEASRLASLPAARALDAGLAVPQLQLHFGGKSKESKGRAGCQALPSSSDALAPGKRTRRAAVKAKSWRSPKRKWEDSGEQRPSPPPQQEVSSQRIFLKLKLSEPDN